MRRTVDVEARAVSAFELGRSHETEGDLEAAQRCYLEAADWGHRGAAAVLGVLLATESVVNDGELHVAWSSALNPLGPAEELWRRAFRGIDPASAREVGQLLGWDRECVETEYRLRIAYEEGDPMAGYQLGRLLEERGSEDEREYGWLKEADTLYEVVLRQTDHVRRAIRRRGGSWWYPGWRLRQVFGTGRAPWGINAHALRARVYAAVRRKQAYRLDHWSRLHARSRLEREHAAGDTEATFLLGILGLANREDDARRWLRLAAEDGHRHAAFELGMYEQAADAGHPGAAYQLAWTAVGAGDWAAAEVACLNAAQGGHLRAVALLRILQRDPKVTERIDDTSGDRRIAELLAVWDELTGLAPEPDRCIDYLAGRSGLPRADVERVRRVRNQCAHPAERGWPSSYEIELALTTAAELRHRVGLPRGGQAQPDVG